MSASTKHSERLLRMPDVISRVGIKRSQIYALVRAGEFPQPIRLSERATAWVESEIDDWITAQVRHSRKLGVDSAVTAN